MIRKINKYLIFIISMLLVLSNFSFATQQMLCMMSEDDAEPITSCSCSHNDAEELPYGPVISSTSSPCCQNKIIVLDNSNNLQITYSQLPKDITVFSPFIVNFEIQQSAYISIFTLNSSVKDHIPRGDIPVLISSLLI